MRVYHSEYEIAKGITFYKPTRVYDLLVSEKEVTVFALIEESVKDEKINGRIIRYRITSPFPNVLRLQIRHHLPGEMIKINFKNEKVSLEVNDDEDRIIITSGLLGVQFEKNKWTYSFKADCLLTGSGSHSSGFLYDSSNTRYMTERLSLGVGDVVYGLGERFSPFIRNGQHVTIWNTDGGTASDMAYKNIPFYLTNGGYGVFVNSFSPVDFEVCTERNNAVRFSVPQGELDYYFFYCPSPKAIVRLYTALTGRPPLIPKWSLGLWLTTSFATDYNDEVISEHIESMFRQKIPLTVFYFDCFWMKERRWCNFLWNSDIFPDPEGMLHRLKQKGLKICLWINPYVSELSEIFEEGVKSGFFLKHKNGDVYQLDWWHSRVWPW